MKKVRVLLADDHIVLTDALANLIRQEFEVIGSVQDGRAMLELARQFQPDVIIVDISMPLLNGMDAARILRKEGIPSRLLFLSMHSDVPLVEEAFRAGASGYVLKICPTEELIAAIHQVAQGHFYITPMLAGDLISTLLVSGQRGAGEPTLSVRQREVVQLLAEGKTMKEVAGVLGISTRTAESHKYEVMRHLGMETTAKLIRYAVRMKLV